jgi:hypothetical protein
MIIFQNRVLFFFFLLWQYDNPIHGQRNPVIYTPSPHLLQTHLVSPDFLPVQKNKLPIYRIEITDNRHDLSKIGFHPKFKNPPKEVRLNMQLTDVFKKVFTDGIQTDDTSNRKLIVIIQDCWISYNARTKFNILKRNLIGELEYKIECFTAQDTNYYPLKRFHGIISLNYDEDKTVKQLVDSMISLVQSGISTLKIGERETPSALIAESRLDNYIMEKKSSIPKRYAYGIYATYEDFLQQKAVTDSIDIIPYRDYYDREVVAAHLGIIKNGLTEPCSKYWGFYNGRYLFYNTGNGYFVRLFPVAGQFVLADLQQIALNTKKKSITSEVTIGKTTYDIIRDYGKVYHMFYQLNLDDGKLY